jgi:hypothetical protein
MRLTIRFGSRRVAFIRPQGLELLGLAYTGSGTAMAFTSPFLSQRGHVCMWVPAKTYWTATTMWTLITTTIGQSFFRRLSPSL